MTTEAPTNEPEFRTITLTGKAPVRIREDLWPVIAHGADHGHDGQDETQATRRWKVDIRVRQNADGRAIVYGTYSYVTNWQDMNFNIKAGKLLEADAGSDCLPNAIKSVAISLCAAGNGHPLRESVQAHVWAAERACVADLPPVDLDAQSEPDEPDLFEASPETGNTTSQPTTLLPQA